MAGMKLGEVAAGKWSKGWGLKYCSGFRVYPEAKQSITGFK